MLYGEVIKLSHCDSRPPSLRTESTPFGRGAGPARRGNLYKPMQRSVIDAVRPFDQRPVATSLVGLRWYAAQAWGHHFYTQLA